MKNMNDKMKKRLIVAGGILLYLYLFNRSIEILMNVNKFLGGKNECKSFTYGHTDSNL